MLNKDGEYKVDSTQPFFLVIERAIPFKIIEKAASLAGSSKSGRRIKSGYIKLPENPHGSHTIYSQSNQLSLFPSSSTPLFLFNQKKAYSTTVRRHHPFFAFTFLWFGFSLGIRGFSSTSFLLTTEETNQNINNQNMDNHQNMDENTNYINNLNIYNKIKDEILNKYSDWYNKLDDKKKYRKPLNIE